MTFICCVWGDKCVGSVVCMYTRVCALIRACARGIQRPIMFAVFLYYLSTLFFEAVSH